MALLYRKVVISGLNGKLLKMVIPIGLEPTTPTMSR